ncbi:hypothetical protein K488DRAFT_91964 [Vararia minispora EC-137]|uniref:Uncharacterized protein n=1 Tax=Vararia minispora EC-137 TaxID=1314806 RepID=A0ACB8Q4U6_9AGAM|nr:hypothetical protein K488DRAFT_91964 [Vararia minispora EC-137]
MPRLQLKPMLQSILRKRPIRLPPISTRILVAQVTGKIKPSASRKMIAVDIVLVGLEALKESADAFPPLKAAVGGLVFFVQLSSQMSSNRAEMRGVYERIEEIEDSLIRAVPDINSLSPAQASAIEAFDIAVQRICADMELLAKQTKFVRFIRARKHGDALAGFMGRLSAAEVAFSVSVSSDHLSDQDC